MSDLDVRSMFAGLLDHWVHRAGRAWKLLEAGRQLDQSTTDDDRAVVDALVADLRDLLAPAARVPDLAVECELTADEKATLGSMGDALHAWAVRVQALAEALRQPDPA